MRTKTFQEKVAILEEFGFTDAPDCELIYAFRSPVYAMDAKMLVQGDHNTDYAYIYYACEQTDEGVLDGLFYAPSLLEYLLTDYQGEWNVSRMLQDVNRQLDGSVRLVGVGGIPFLFRPIQEYCWKTSDLRFQISDMLKVIGQLDYLLPRKWKRLQAIRSKE